MRERRWRRSSCRSGVVASAFATPKQLEDAIRLQREQRDLVYVRVPATSDPNVTINDAQVEQYYHEHQQRFVEPEKVKVDYLELDAKSLAGGIPAPPEAELRKMYDEQPGRFGQEEERRASHILVQLAPDADAKAVAAAKARIAGLQKRLQAGEPFDKVAREASDDTASAQQGGDLGYFTRGAMDPAFEKAAFALKEGEVSEPVRTDFGLHLIKITGIRAGSVKPFEAVRDQLLAEYRQREAEKQFYDRSDRLTDLTYEHPDSLDAAAEGLDLKVQHSSWIKRDTGEGIAQDPKVRSAAFSEDVLTRGYNSAPVELGPNHVVVVHVIQHEPETPEPLQQVHDQIVELLRKTQAQDKARAQGEALLDAAVKGGDLQALAKQQGLKVEQANSVLRDAQQPAPEIVHTAFAAGRPEKGKTVYRGTPLAGGDYAVVGVVGVKEGDLKALPEDQRTAERRALAQMQGSSDFSALQKSLREHSDIVVHADKLGAE